jgi:hypothetical protein
MSTSTFKKHYTDLLESCQSSYEDGESFDYVAAAFPEKFAGITVKSPFDDIIAVLQTIDPDSYTGMAPKKKKVRVRASDKSTVVETSSTEGRAISEAAGAYRLCENDTLSQDLIKEISATCGPHPVKRVIKALANIVAKGQHLSKMSRWGEFFEISDAEFVTWSSSHKKDVIILGPHMLQKFLAQANVSYEREVIPGSGNWNKWTRNGVTVASTDRDELLLDKYDHDSEEKAWEALLEEFFVIKKQVVYTPIDFGAYKTFDIFASLYQVKVKDNKMSAHAWESKMLLPTHVVSKMEDLKTFLGEKTFMYTDADHSREDAARYIMEWKHYEEMDPIISSLEDNANIQLEQYVDKLPAFKVPASEKIRKLSEITGTKTVLASVTKLDDLRKNRNKESAINQYVNKNVGSVTAYYSPQAFETMDKGFNIVAALEHYGLRPKEKEWAVYGVAYGHMNRGFDETDLKCSYYDIKRADMSSAKWTHGDICNANSPFIIDDTYIQQPPDSYPSGRGKHYTYDHHKLEWFASAKCPSKVIVTKLSMERFKTKEQVAELRKILLPPPIGSNPPKPPFRSFTFFKVGKLHNAEFFALLLKIGPERPPMFDEDLGCIATCMSAANDMITIYQRRGLRLRPKTNGKILSEIWIKLVQSLPCKWPWYKATVKRSGGEFTRVLRMDEAANYDRYDEEVEYAEVVDDEALQELEEIPSGPQHDPPIEEEDSEEDSDEEYERPSDPITTPPKAFGRPAVPQAASPKQSGIIVSTPKKECGELTRSTPPFELTQTSGQPSGGSNDQALTRSKASKLPQTESVLGQVIRKVKK